MNRFKLFSTFDIILSSLFVALFTIGAYIRIPILGIPFTLQLFFVLLAGQLLKWHTAVFSIVSYIALGLIGLPVFSGGGGVGYVLTPSFGYLLGFIVCAFFVSTTVKSGSAFKLIFKNLIGVFLVYFCGIIYTLLLTAFYFDNKIDFWAIILSGTLVFIPTDILFCVFSAFISKRLNRFFINIRS